MRALYLHKLKQEKEGKLGKGRKADRAPCLAVERFETLAEFNERFGQGQTTCTRQGIGWNQNKSVPFSTDKGPLAISSGTSFRIWTKIAEVASFVDHQSS